MAGRVVVSTLNDDTGVLNTQNGMRGIPKAWVNFNGSTAAIRDSFNVGSITKNGTGDYTVNFTTTLPNANYAVAGWAANNAGTAKPVVCQTSTRTTYTTSAVAVQVGESNVSTLAPFDTTAVCVAIFSS